MRRNDWADAVVIVVALLIYGALMVLMILRGPR